MPPASQRSEYQQVARIRLREAKALLAAKQYSGAYYFCGIAIECAIKAVIAKRTKRHQFPEKNSHKFYVHDPTVLANLAGLDFQAFARIDKIFGQNWAVVKDWTVESRYDVIDRQRAVELYRAIVARKHGVLQWLRQNW